MTIRSRLSNFAEISEILLYSQLHPMLWATVKYERRKRLIDKHRDALTDNRYFTGFVEPMVLRLHDHATHSRNIIQYPCDYKGTTFVYTIKGRPVYPILTMGSEKQLQEICKKECYVCPTAVYSPFGVMAGLIQLAFFETSRLISKAKSKSRLIS